MASVYFRDKNVSTTGIGSRRSLAELSNLISDIAPTSQVRKDKLVKLGFIVHFVDDKMSNFIFDPANTRTLSQHNFAAELTYNSQDKRDIYLPNIPSDIFAKSEDIIRNELITKLQMQVFDVIKFTSNKTGIRYIKFTADCTESKLGIINAGKFPFFNIELTPQVKIANTRSRINNGPNPHIIPSAQDQGQALAHSSNWADPGPQPNPRNITYQPPGYQLLHPQGPGPQPNPEPRPNPGPQPCLGPQPYLGPGSPNFTPSRPWSSPTPVFPPTILW